MVELSSGIMCTDVWRYNHIHHALFLYIHVHVYLQLQNYDTLCRAVITAAERNAPALLQQAEAIADKFMQAFNLFGRCHRIYDSAELLSDMDLTELGTAGHCSNTAYTVHVYM